MAVFTPVIIITFWVFLVFGEWNGKNDKFLKISCKLCVLHMLREKKF